MVQRNLDLLFWGYIANVLHSLLKPYKQGKAVNITDEDRQIIEQAKKLLDSMIKGCDSVTSLGNLSFTHSHTELPSVTALNLAVEIFLAMAVTIPNELEGFRTKLNTYQDILEKVKTSKAISSRESNIADEVTDFFRVLGNKADQASYETAYSL